MAFHATTAVVRCAKSLVKFYFRFHNGISSLHVQFKLLLTVYVCARVFSIYSFNRWRPRDIIALGTLLLGWEGAGQPRATILCTTCEHGVHARIVLANGSLRRCSERNGVRN